MTASSLFSVYAPGGVTWEGAEPSTVLCTRCGEKFNTLVQNSAYNRLACPGCAAQLQQLINATPHTIRPNAAITAAHLYDVGTSLPEPGYLRIYNQLDVINSRAEPVIQVCRVGEPHEPPFFEHRTPLITPGRNLGSWQMSCFVPIAFFPRRECQVVIELSVANTWGDHLARHLNTLNTLDLFRRMIQAEFKLLSAEQPALAHAFRQMDADTLPRNGRYTPLVLQLADYLLDR